MENEHYTEGMHVMVRSRYLGAWVRGFEVSGVTSDGYRIRRVSDGAELPSVVGFTDVAALPPALPDGPRDVPWQEPARRRRVTV